MPALLLDTFAQGGWIMWPILGVSCVVWGIGLFKLYGLMLLGRARRRFAAALSGGGGFGESTGSDLFDSLLRLAAVGAGEGARRAKFREVLLTVGPELEGGLDTMAAWIAVAPLLGLLGTVAGMVETFNVITRYGVGNPGLTAEGISIALLTTEAGLTVAFPAMLLHVFLVNRKNLLRKQLLLDGEALVRGGANGAARHGGDNP